MQACSCTFIRFIQLVVVSEQFYMDGREFRKKRGWSHPQLGVKPCRLPGSQLLTCVDVVGGVMMLRLQNMEEQKTLNINHLSIKNYITRVADEVPRIWKRAPVPMRCRHHVIEMARQLRAKGDNICKSGKSKRATMGAAAAAAMMPMALSLQR